MKNLVTTIVFFFTISSPLFASTLSKGQMMLSTDFSYTSARELWKGNSEEITYQDAEGDTHADGSTKDGQTRFYNYGLVFAYGTPFAGIQADLRLDYTASRMKDATHPNAANGVEGGGVNQLSGVELKLAKDISTTFTGYISYKHPIEDAPESPSFLAVNDFSTHLTLGFKYTHYFTGTFATFFDYSYTFRSAADLLTTEDLPSDQMTAKLDFLYMHDKKLSLGAGLVWKHTLSGPDISTSTFGTLATTTGHPPFYAARERFAANVIYLNYYTSPSSWIGLTQFKKFWGRNTDVSTTRTLFYGFTF